MDSLRALIVLTLLGFFAFAGTPALAQGKAKKDIDLNVNIGDGCSIQADDMHFGLIFGTTGSAQSSAQVRINCTPGLRFNVMIDHGQHANGVNRRMRNATTGDFMRYRVYSNPARTRVWSDKRSELVAGNSGATGLVELTAYGEIPAIDTTTRAGIYQDTLTVTIEF